MKTKELHALIEACQLKISPSLCLSSRAQAHGFTQVKVLPHAIVERIQHQGGNGILYLGTISHHKGADLVFDAIQKAFPTAPPKVTFHGFPVDQEMAIRIGARGPLNRGEVWDALSNPMCL